MTDPDRLYFRQLLSGQDFAAGDQVAEQMVNYAYLIGDRQTGKAVVVDPAYSPAELLDALNGDGMDLDGILVTHHHPDHVGGNFMGHSLSGLAELVGLRPVPVHANRHEVDSIAKVTGLSPSDIVAHDAADLVSVGDLQVQLLHTPGHTPGSQCFLVEEMLVSGDTLFLDGCGRTDLPGSNAEDMYRSLQLLAGLPEGTAVFPGHRYSPHASASMAAVKETNMVYKPPTMEAWMQVFGG